MSTTFKMSKKGEKYNGGEKKRMLEIVDSASTFINMSCNISSYISGMNSHLKTIAVASSIT